MTSQQPVIVVGVDGSEASMDAFRWAIRQAELTGGRLRAVCAWRQPVTYGMPVDYSDVDFEKEARRRLETAITDAPGTQSEVPVETVVVEGLPAHVLVDAAKDADLLAVGSQGHGAFAGMVLGSTGHYCAQHSPCPRVIVPHRREPAPRAHDGRQGGTPRP